MTPINSWTLLKMDLTVVTMILLLAFLSVHICSVRSTSEKRLITMLLENYKQNGIEGRPVVNTSRSLPVSIGFSLLQILDFNQDKQSITLVGWISLQWQDSLLRWNAYEFDNIRQVVLHPDQIWTPDVVLFNAISPPKVIHDTKLLVSSNGEILWVSHIQYDMTCVTSPAQEESECEMKFGSWTLNTELLRLTSVSETLDLANYVDHVEWALAQSFVTTSVFEYPCCPGVRYGVVSYSFVLRRRTKNGDHVVRFRQEVASAKASGRRNTAVIYVRNYRAAGFIAGLVLTVDIVFGIR